jgi:hypothetical protein
MIRLLDSISFPLTSESKQPASSSMSSTLTQPVDGTTTTSTVVSNELDPPAYTPNTIKQVIQHLAKAFNKDDIQVVLHKAR